MELSSKQMELINSSFGLNTLIEGYSGVGKTTVLLKKYEKIYNNNTVSRNDTVYIVSDYLKKQIILHQYFLHTSNYNALNIYTINELIYKYLKRINLPLFKNTIDEKQKYKTIKEIIFIYYRYLLNEFSLDFIIDEINFIQSNICIKDNDTLDVTLNKELKMYLVTPRKSFKKGLLSFREKQDIWSIYTDYLRKALNEDFFDEQTFYQSFLRLLYHQQDNNELSMSFSNILIDDIEDFTKVQLDIIYYLYDKNKDNHSLMMTLDDIKAKDRYKNFKHSNIFKCITNNVILDTNYRSSKNVFNIIKSYLSYNELVKPNLNYLSENNKVNLKSVLTYFYNKKTDEKREVFFDRLDLLINNMDYHLNDILVVFNDLDNLNEMKNECLDRNINVLDIYDYAEKREKDGIVFIYKEDLINCEFKVVIVYDALNKKLCTGPVNKIINVNKNFEDSIYFYITLSNAKDFIIINSSLSEPSHLLLPSNIDFKHFVFEIDSKFKIKSTLNIYRMSDFTAWIKNNLITHYDYDINDFKSHSIFEIIIDVNYNKIGIKILDNNIDTLMIGNILKNGRDLTHIVIFDSHHYITFKNVNNEFIRISDIPNKQ